MEAGLKELFSLSCEDQNEDLTLLSPADWTS